MRGSPGTLSASVLEIRPCEGSTCVHQPSSGFGVAARFSDFQAVASLCIPFSDFLRHTDLRGEELMEVAGVQTRRSHREE